MNGFHEGIAALTQGDNSSLTTDGNATSSVIAPLSIQQANEIPPVISDWQRETLSPVSSGERIETLDVLRGFALFGILTVNIVAFSWPHEYILLQSEFSDSWADAVVEWLVRFLAEGKFYPLFSFLFGLGAAIQMERAESHGVSFAGRHCRRMAVLLVFGIAHGLLIWEGDILVSYAVAGFLLPLFWKRQPRTILIWALVCCLIPALLIILFWALLTGLLLVPEMATAIEKGLSEYYGTDREQREAVEDVIRVFASGTYAEIFRERLSNVIYMWMGSIFHLPSFLGLFLLGLYAGKRRWFQDVEGNQEFFRRVLVWGLVIGLPFNIFYVVCMASADLSHLHLLWLLSYGLVAISGPVQGLAYAAALTLVLRRERWKQCCRGLGDAGRMALTNYVSQSLIGTMIFYSYGFGLFGAVDRATSFGLAVVIFAGQMTFSVWWLKRFQFGPMEWLWRTLTYGKCQPLRR